jgi:hypothetical protein
MKDCAIAGIEKETSRKVNGIQKQKSKRKKGEPKAKPDIVLDNNNSYKKLLSAWPAVCKLTSIHVGFPLKVK